jgi:hypothetical protein
MRSFLGLIEAVANFVIKEHCQRSKELEIAENVKLLRRGWGMCACRGETDLRTGLRCRGDPPLSLQPGNATAWGGHRSRRSPSVRCAVAAAKVSSVRAAGLASSCPYPWSQVLSHPGCRSGSVYRESPRQQSRCSHTGYRHEDTGGVWCFCLKVIHAHLASRISHLPSGLWAAVLRSGVVPSPGPGTSSRL